MHYFYLTSAEGSWPGVLQMCWMQPFDKDRDDNSSQHCLNFQNVFWHNSSSKFLSTLSGHRIRWSDFLWMANWFIALLKLHRQFGVMVKHQAKNLEIVSSTLDLGTKPAGWPWVSHLFSALGSRPCQINFLNLVKKTAGTCAGSCQESIRIVDFWQASEREKNGLKRFYEICRKKWTVFSMRK